MYHGRDKEGIFVIIQQAFNKDQYANLVSS
jgi:hypothetical protein